MKKTQIPIKIPSMYSFLVLSIPSVALIFCLRSKYNFRDFLIPIAAGLISGAVVAVAQEFFIFSVYVPTSFFPEHVAHLAGMIFFPSVFITVIYFLLSKDEFDFKAESLFPLLAFFYAVYFPYKTISEGEKTTLFAVLLNPVLTIATIFFVQSAAVFVCKAEGKKNRILSAVILVVLTCVLQPVIQSVWYFKIFGNLYLFLAIFYIVAVFVFGKFAFRKTNSLDTVQ